MNQRRAMKDFIKKLFIRRSVHEKMTQEQIIEFIQDNETISRAARGSMNKRNDLLQRVESVKKHA